MFKIKHCTTAVINIVLFCVRSKVHKYTKGFDSLKFVKHNFDGKLFHF